MVHRGVRYWLTFVTGDAGVHTFSNGVTLVTAGTRSITATELADALATGTQSGITVNAASTDHYYVSGFSNPVTTGTAGTVSLQARDAYNNFAASYTGTVHFTSSDPWN